MARPSQQPPLVVHVIHSLGTGGLENGLVNIINRTPPERYRHAIVCLTEAGEFAKRIVVPDVPVVELHKRSGHDLRLYWRLFRTLRALRPAIVHTRNLATLEMQFVAALLVGVKRVHGEHGRDVFDLDGSNRKYNVLRRAARLVVQRYIAVSKDLEQWLVSTVGVSPAKVTQIYNGVDQHRFRPREGARPDVTPPGFLPADALVVGTVGRLAEVKNQLSLLRAVQRLLQAHPELAARLRVIVVGDGPMTSQIARAVTDLGLDRLVWLPGDRRDIPRLLQCMDVFVLPSLGEGISNTVLEAMSTGLPVIATRVGGNPELIEDGECGKLVPVSDDAALAAAIGELIMHASQRIRLGEQCRRKASERFDWAHTVDCYLWLYDQLLKRTVVSFQQVPDATVERQGKQATMMSVNNGPVFIVGAPRSGTTLLQYMLRAHPRISLPTGESHYFIPLLRSAADYGDLGTLAAKKVVLAAMYRQSAEFLDTDLHGMRFDIDELANEFQAQGRDTMESLLSGVLERNAGGEGKSRWGDKTPYYVLHLERLKQAFPDAQFIHLIRDGRDVALSLFGRRDDFHVHNVYCAAKYWQHYVEIGREQGLRLGKDAYFELRYEDLIREPKSALQGICAFLNEEFLDELLNYKRAGEKGKTPLVSQPLQPRNKEKWRSELSRWQLFVFDSVASGTLRACGYETATKATRPLPFPLRAGFRLHNQVVSKLRHNRAH